ncbi:helix-turn-helix transcriptional regulator [Streptomyces djakartensis]|uniref:helix-turn-helix transcriptional regulator n=1 Tax=Streptomyces djakartensis TaxID=68193 RepID=UPI0034DF96FE
MGALRQAAQWPFTGRQGELESFDAAWAQEQCNAVVIFGPAGVGKSRLAEEMAARASRTGWRTRRATATVTAATVSLGALAHLIPADVDMADPVKGFAAVRASLAANPRRRWLVLLDDIHLLDAASAMLLRQLLDAHMVRLIGTIRNHETISDAVGTLIHGDRVFRLDLTPFDLKQSQELLESALGSPTSRRTLAALHNASSGNPLYLRELVTGALQAGKLTTDGEIWQIAKDHTATTPHLEDLIRSRLASTHSAATDLLDLLALCESLPLTDALDVTSLEILARIESDGIIKTTIDRRRTTVALAHPLYGETLRARIVSERRQQLLLDQIDRVQAYGARRRDDALQIATWRLAATGTADPALLIQGATLARHAHDYPHSLALLEALPAKEQTPHTRILQGDALINSGQGEAGEAMMKLAYETAESERDKALAALMRSFAVFWGAGRAGDALAINTSAAQELTGTVERRLLALNEGAMRAVTGDPSRAVSLLQELEHQPEECEDLNTWLFAAMMRTVALALTGHTCEAIEWGEHAYRSHQRVDYDSLMTHPNSQINSLLVPLTENGRLKDALLLGTQAFDDLLAANLSLPRVWMAFHLGRAEWVAGHIQASRRWFAEAASLARNLPVPIAGRLALKGLSACAAILGDEAAAHKALNESDRFPTMGLFEEESVIALAWIRASTGRISDARAHLRRAYTTARRKGLVTSEALLLTDIARLGNPEEVCDRLNELAHHCDGHLTPARAKFVSALVTQNPDALLASAEALSSLGVDLLAAEAASVAATQWHRRGEIRKATQAANTSHRYAALCGTVHTPLLTVAEPIATLTTREREIARLAADGTSSKDIAVHLTLSVRTVDNHLQRIYSKLGISTRRQLSTLLHP